MLSTLRVAHDIHLRIDEYGALLAWSPRASAEVPIGLTELAILKGIGSGAAPRQALEAAGLSPRTDAEVEAYFVWLLQHGFVEQGARTPAKSARDAVLAAVEGGAVAAAALLDAARKVRARLREQVARPRLPVAVPAEPLDLDFSTEPTWQVHVAAPPTVGPQPRGPAPAVTRSVTVSATAYPLT